MAQPGRSLEIFFCWPVKVPLPQMTAGNKESLNKTATSFKYLSLPLQMPWKWG